LLFVAILLQFLLLLSAAAPLACQDQSSPPDRPPELDFLEASIPLSVAARSEQVPTRKVWAPGGLAMTLFTETELTIATTSLPAGAYTMYLLPGKKDWTLIVRRNVTIDRQCDQNQDLVRATMQTGELSQPEEQLKAFLGHIGPKRCEINADYGKNRAWVELMQK
jgi:hypothetical protein